MAEHKSLDSRVDAGVKALDAELGKAATADVEGFADVAGVAGVEALSKENFCRYWPMIRVAIRMLCRAVKFGWLCEILIETGDRYCEKGGSR